jgi:isocitrate dehydrogenase
MTKPWLVYGISRGDDMSNNIVQIVDFLNDFSNASSRAQQMDRNILQDAASVSNVLGDLVSLAIAQVYGSTQLTIGADLNKSDVMMFMKNIGGNKDR